MIARAIENLFYNAAVSGTHRALCDMGMIPPDCPGSPVEQVRALLAPQQPALPAAPEVVAESEGRKGRANT
jgi:hypothetical protein